MNLESKYNIFFLRIHVEETKFTGKFNINAYDWNWQACLFHNFVQSPIEKKLWGNFLYKKALPRAGITNRRKRPTFMWSMHFSKHT